MDTIIIRKQSPKWFPKKKCPNCDKDMWLVKQEKLSKKYYSLSFDKNLFWWV